MVPYGALAPPAALAIPKHGWVNPHFSLLPAWRGAAPVQHAVLHGDEVTGASVQLGDLLDRLSVSGARPLVAVLDGIASGTLTPVPRPAEGVSLALKITVEDVAVRCDEPALAVDRRIRAGTEAATHVAGPPPKGVVRRLPGMPLVAFGSRRGGRYSGSDTSGIAVASGHTSTP